MRSDLRRCWWLALLWLAMAACLPDGKLKTDYNDAPPSLDDGWTVARPETEGIDPGALHAVYVDLFSENAYVPIRSLLVVRHGVLVGEGYMRDLADRDRLRNIMSATKSITALLVGVALDRGVLSGIDQHACAALPDKCDGDPRRQLITVADLLAMRSGIDFSNDDFSKEMVNGDASDSLAFTLHRPMKFTPNAQFDYEDCNPHVVGGLLQRAFGERLGDIANAALFSALGMHSYVWETHEPDGVDYGAFSLYLRPRDMAKLGQLLLQRGSWAGRSLVSSSWVDEATSTKSDTGDDPRTQAFAYGYGYWIVPELQAYTAWGHGGQYIFVIPRLDLVIVATAEPDTNGDRVAIQLDQFVPLVSRVVAATEP